jgi:Tfp pilus assembly protein PilO
LNISKLDKKQSIMLGIVAAIALFAGFYMLYYVPSQKKSVEMYQEIEAKEKKLRTARMHGGLFEPLKKQVAEMEAQLNEFKAKIATKAEVILLIKTVEDEALRMNMKVKNMHAKVEAPPPPPPQVEGEEAPPPDPMSGYNKVVLDVSLQGKYKQLEELLKALQDLETYVTIEKLDISGGKMIYPMLTSEIEINLYSKKLVASNAIAE